MNGIYTGDLYRLLPSIYRIRDAGQGYRLKALFEVLAAQGKIVEADIGRLYDNCFIETCEEWVVPYLAALLGVRGLLPHARAAWSQRALVANTLRYRQRKGTVPLLEQLTYDVADWAGKAVELYSRVAVTQCLDHLRMSSATTASLRDLHDNSLVGSAFDPLTYTPDVRLMSGTRQAPQLEAERPVPRSGRKLAGVGQARPNLPNVGLFIWRLKPYRIDNATAFSHGDGQRYSFSPLGNDIPLFNSPPSRKEFDNSAQEFDLPVALRSEALKGTELNPSFFTPIPAFKVADINWKDLLITDLSDWNRQGSNAPAFDAKHEVAVDPELGRIYFSKKQNANHLIPVTYSYAFSDAIGGGSFDRPTRVPTVRDKVIDSPREDELAAALKSWGGEPVIHVKSNATYRMPSQPAAVRPTHQQLQVRAYKFYEQRGKKDGNDWADWFRAEAELLPRPVQQIELKGSQLVIQAANRFRPAIIGDLQIVGGKGAGRVATAELTLSGLVIAGQIKISGRLGKLSIVDCTLVPGIRLNPDGGPVLPLVPSIVAENPDKSLQVIIQRSIVGPIRLPKTIGKLTIQDSIVDAPVASRETKMPSAGRGQVLPYSGIVFRPVLAPPRLAAIAGPDQQPDAGPIAQLERVTVFGSVYLSGMPSAGNVLFTDPLVVDRTAIGQMRNCYVPLGSRTPTLARQDCVNPSSTLLPAFVARSYGAPGYAQLSLACPAEIRAGGTDGAEIGAFHRLRQPQREGALLSQLEEYLRFGLEAGLIYVT